jgi:hypothetical protein
MQRTQLHVTNFTLPSHHKAPWFLLSSLQAAKHALTCRSIVCCTTTSCHLRLARIQLVPLKTQSLQATAEPANMQTNNCHQGFMTQQCTGRRHNLRLLILHALQQRHNTGSGTASRSQNIPIHPDMLAQHDLLQSRTTAAAAAAVSSA